MTRRAGNTPSPTLAAAGELDVISRLHALLLPGADVVRGVGDDCAVVRPAGSGAEDWLLTTDPVIERVHFEPDAAPEAIGHKAVGRVLSDLAAMGGAPCWALIDLVAPRATPVARVEGLYRGAVALAARYGMAIVGGDLSDGPVLEAHVFGIGRLPAGTAVAREGAGPGDGLYVTGALGGSRLGRHMAFEPRVREGCFLRDWATAMLDLSDGLGADLRRLAAAGGTGFRVELPRVPVAEAAHHAAAQDSRPALVHAFDDGEDFELLFTVRAERESAFRAAWHAAFATPCARIGTATAADDGITARDAAGCQTALPGRGFLHWTAP
jgi:thiamine-monophosphate kinase